MSSRIVSTAITDPVKQSSAWMFRIALYSGLVITALVLLIWAINASMSAGTSWWASSSAGRTAHATVSTHLTSGCDQTLSDPFPLGSAPIPVTDGTLCYALLNVLSGEVRVEGPGGYIDVGPYGIIGQHTAPGWRAVSMYALKPAVVQKRLCPPGTTGWNGQQCV